MPEGLLAQWHRGIALRGIAGAGLLMIPVLVAGTIGFGGVGDGLTSLASGPSESAVNPPSGPRSHASKSIDSLSASIPGATTFGQTPGDATGGDSSRSPSGGGAGPGTTSPTTSADSGSSSDPAPAVASAGAPAAQTNTGSPDTTGGQAGPVTVPVNNPDIVGNLIQTLLGQTP